MITKFVNKLTVSGILTPFSKDIKGLRGASGYLFQLEVPRNKTNSGNITHLFCSIWGSDVHISKPILERLKGQRITVTGKLTTSVSKNGSENFVLRVKDFVEGWYDIGTKKEIGEIYKFRLSGETIKDILENISSEDI